MKTLALIVVYFITFWGLFLLFSTAGLIWTSYWDTIMDQGWLGCYTLFLGLWMAGLVTWEVYKQLFKAGNQNTKSKKNDTDSFERVTFEEARIGLLFDIDIELNSCSHCGKNAKELAWFKFNSPAEAWGNLAGRSGYYSYCPDCDCPSEDFITAMN